jgi:hypothetical protein
VSVEVPQLPCYIVEWYRAALTATPLGDIAARLEESAAMVCDEGASIHLLMTLAVPDDEVLFAVFTADSAQSVSETCRRAGLPAERLTNAADARVAG